jgi:AAA family ATP:ADP antiporter
VSSTNYTTLRKIFWPIESFENKKFLPMAAMMFFILFNYSMLRTIKDSFVLETIGPEAISFLKTYVVLPSAILAMIVYIKLCNIMTPQKVFYAISGFFVVYLAFFTFVLYPNPSFAHPAPEAIEALAAGWPNLKWFIRAAGNWGISTFYAVSELWGSMMLSLLFWQFANQITKTDEAKRFYSMFGMLGNIGLLCTSGVISYFLGQQAAELAFSPLLSIAIVNGVMVMLLYWWINENVLTDIRLYNPGEQKSEKKKKPKLSLKESFKLIFSSKYLGMIAILVLAYGISVNLIEGVWKAKVKELFVTKEAIALYMGQFQGWMGLGAIMFMVIGSNILRSVSWRTAAMLTPAMMMITGLAFFAFILFAKELDPYISNFVAMTPLALAVTIGMIQNVLSKATKYSLFDSTKEMSYIPLDDELKSKGKAAVDVVGGRFGKSGGGIIQSTFFIIFPNLNFNDATPYFAVICIFIIICWLYGVSSLSTEYEKQVDGHKY